MPISHPQMFSETSCCVLFSCKMRKLWPGSHVEISWGNTKHRPPAGAQPIGTLSLWNDLWLAKVSRHGLDFLMLKQSHEEVQKSLRALELQYAERLLWNFWPMLPKIFCRAASRILFELNFFSDALFLFIPYSNGRKMVDWWSWNEELSDSIPPHFTINNLNKVTGGWRRSPGAWKFTEATVGWIGCHFQ